jgi:hypothetical protein
MAPRSARLSALPFHAILLGLFPVLYLIETNLGELQLADAWRVLALIPAIELLLLSAFMLLLRSLRKAAVLTSATMLLLLSYGHVYSVLKAIQIGGYTLGRHRFLVPTWIVVLAALYLWMARQKGDLIKATGVLNAIGVVAVALPSLSFIAFYASVLASRVAQAQPNPGLDGEQTAAHASELPDIYYIITDAYGRSDVLVEHYQYDNSEFLDSLVDQGFYLADRSVANYLWTHLSLATSLNMDYIPEIIPGWRQGSQIDSVELIRHSRVREQLQALGYSTVGFATGWEASELFDAEYVLTPDISRMELLSQQGMFNDFEGLVIHSSVLRVLEDLDARSSTPVSRYVSQRLQRRFTVQREIILAQFDNLARVPGLPGPKFAFVHIISPHGPYIFGPQGEERTSGGPFTLAPASDLGLERDSELYIDQLVFISSKLAETVSTILSESERPVVIILQSDHGPAPGLDLEHPEPEPLLAKSGILNAYYVPEPCKPLLYPGISPVNTFRVIFNCLFEEDLPLLEDVTYFGIEEFVPLDEFIAE